MQIVTGRASQWRAMSAPADDDIASGPSLEALVHELNNVLSAVLGYAEIVHLDAGAGKVEERDAVQVIAATRRAIELTDALAALIAARRSDALPAEPTGSEPIEPA